MQISKLPSNNTLNKLEESFEQPTKSMLDMVESFNAGNSNINHYLESEENNNIPEINSFGNQLEENSVVFKIVNIDSGRNQS
jgi:hypothetical protein